ncbi:MAG: hypothetical protein M0Q25_02735 [Sulfurospirillaceae bacterium]|nr:hypothetical protein [Sulfurospirillaceae bacterium]
MNKKRLLFFLLFFLMPTFIFAEPNWAFWHKFELKKDEQAHIYVYDAKNEEIEAKIYTFSWTLFDTKQLILHTRYRDFPKQQVLTLERGKRALKELLLEDKVDRLKSKTNLLLEFTQFNNEDKIATIEAFIEDRAKRVKIEFYDPRIKE